MGWPADAAEPHAQLAVLGGFALHGSDGVELAVAPAGQRLLAMLALRSQPAGRGWLAESLWADSDERHAAWSLRALLHRLPRPDGRSLLRLRQDRLTLA